MPVGRITRQRYANRRYGRPGFTDWNRRLSRQADQVDARHKAELRRYTHAAWPVDVAEYCHVWIYYNATMTLLKKKRRPHLITRSRKGGPPQENTTALCDLLAAGTPLRDACILAGLSPQAVDYWRSDKNEDTGNNVAYLREFIGHAMALFTSKQIEIIKMAAQGEFTATETTTTIDPKGGATVKTVVREILPDWKARRPAAAAFRPKPLRQTRHRRPCQPGQRS